MPNAYRALLKLLPQRPLMVGTVVSVDDGVATIELPGGGVHLARGSAELGTLVFFRDGAIEGEAPELTVVLIDV